jgi:hypothetical protein
MPAGEPDTAEARPVAAAVRQLADEISVQATGARWLCGLADDVDPSRTEEGTSE